jgi:hypothetical protein
MNADGVCYVLPTFTSDILHGRNTSDEEIGIASELFVLVLRSLGIDLALLSERAVFS